MFFERAWNRETSRDEVSAYKSRRGFPDQFTRLPSPSLSTLCAQTALRHSVCIIVFLRVSSTIHVPCSGRLHFRSCYAAAMP